MFQDYLKYVMPAILDGLVSENESVRDAALSAGHIFVEHYATTSLPLLLSVVEDGIFSDNWRIRHSSIKLLGDLLFKVGGTSGKAVLEGGSDDEGASTEAQGRAIIEGLDRDKRNDVLAAIYMVRTDISLSVRQLGGINSYLQIERASQLSHISASPTVILRVDVSHGSPRQSDVPSIVAVKQQLVLEGMQEMLNDQKLGVQTALNQTVQHEIASWNGMPK